MGAGALLVGVAWRGGEGPPPLAAMVTVTFVMGLSAFAGAVSGSTEWLHYLLLAVSGLGAGLIVAVGRRSAVIGLQAIIAIVVFGRFPQPLPQAAGLAPAGDDRRGRAGDLLRAGRRPAGRAPALCHGGRGVPAAGPAGRRSVWVDGRRRDDAEAKLTSPSLLGDSTMMSLSSLVDEADGSGWS
jgi:hypothetical protein